MTCETRTEKKNKFLKNESGFVVAEPEMKTADKTLFFQRASE